MTAGSSLIGSWTTAFTLPSGTTIGQLWSGTLTVSGTSVTVKNAAWNGLVDTARSTTYGFIGSGTAPTTAPAVTCTVG